MCFHEWALYVQTLSTWTRESYRDDPELKKIADTLPINVLHSKGTSFTRKYLGSFNCRKATPGRPL